MRNVESRALVEFTQTYRHGIKITKRGLSATPVICRKYGLTPGKVAVFSSPMGGRKAMTVFHFHPSCSSSKRRIYMRKHKNAAREIARQVRSSQAGGLHDLRSAQHSLSALWRELAADFRAMKSGIALSLGIAPQRRLPAPKATLMLPAPQRRVA